MASPLDPNQQAAHEARQEAFRVLATAVTFDELKDGVGDVYALRRPRHGHEAAQILNFLDFRDPTKLTDVPLDHLRKAFARIAERDPEDPRAAEYLKLLS
jgi:L-alanine-DL-glutamate epimerase-like enolase superfamily enzyme